MFNRLLKNRVAKIGISSILMLCVAIFVASAIIPVAVEEWVGNGTVFSVTANGATGGIMNTLWVTVGSIVIIATVVMAFLRSR